MVAEEKTPFADWARSDTCERCGYNASNHSPSYKTRHPSSPICERAVRQCKWCHGWASVNSANGQCRECYRFMSPVKIAIKQRARRAEKMLVEGRIDVIKKEHLLSKPEIVKAARTRQERESYRRLRHLELAQKRREALRKGMSAKWTPELPEPRNEEERQHQITLLAQSQKADDRFGHIVSLGIPSFDAPLPGSESEGRRFSEGFVRSAHLIGSFASVGLCDTCERFSEDLKDHLCASCWEALEREIRMWATGWFRGLPTSKSKKAFANHGDAADVADEPLADTRTALVRIPAYGEIHTTNRMKPKSKKPTEIVVGPTYPKAHRGKHGLKRLVYKEKVNWVYNTAAPTGRIFDQKRDAGKHRKSYARVTGNELFFNEAWLRNGISALVEQPS